MNKFTQVLNVMWQLGQEVVGQIKNPEPDRMEVLILQKISPLKAKQGERKPRKKVVREIEFFQMCSIPQHRWWDAGQSVVAEILID